MQELTYTLNLALILTLGVLTSYEDFKRNRISNMYIIAAVVAAFFINIVDNYLAIAPWSTKQLYIQTTILNACISLLAGFVLWYLKIWRAGDGKLFFAYASLVPISTYYYGYIPYFPSFAILINTLTPLFLLLTLNLWVITSTDEKLEILKNAMDPKQIFYMLLTLVSIQWILSIIFQQLRSINDVFMTGFLSIFVLFFLRNRFQDFIYEASVPIAILRLLLDYGTITSYAFITQFLILFILFALLINFITNLGSFRFTENMRIADLRPGMCCVEKVVRKGNFYTKISAELEPTRCLNLSYEDLAEADIKKLNTLHKKNKLKFSNINVKQTMPFAPFLFLGVLLTFLIRGDATTYLKLLVLSLM